MKIKSKDFERCVRKVESLEQRLHSHALSRDPMCDALMLLCAQKETVRLLAFAMVAHEQMEAEIKAVKKMLKDSKSVLQLDELKARKRVLRRCNPYFIAFHRLNFNLDIFLNCEVAVLQQRGRH
jgi:ATP-dependent RNA helicase DOB1